MLVSIIITNHNYGRFLGNAIQSARKQRFLQDGDWEVLVVEDGSNDDSKHVIESHREGIQAIFHDEPHGLPAAINSGIRASTGSYILRLDADDWLDSHAVFLLSYFLDNNPEIGFVWPDYHIYNSAEQIIDRISEPQGAGIMFRRQLLLDVGLYDEEMLMYEDRDILLRCAAKAPGHHIKLPLYCYKRHEDNMSIKYEELNLYDELLNKKHGDELQSNLSRVYPGFSGPIAPNQ